MKEVAEQYMMLLGCLMWISGMMAQGEETGAAGS